MHAGSVVGGCTADDPVVIIRKALCFHPRLLPAGRTTYEVAMCGGTSIEGFDQSFGFHGHYMSRSIAPVLPTLGTTNEGCGVFAGRRSHAHVGVDDGIAALDACGERPIADAAGEPPIPGPLQASVPVRFRHPEFDAYRGIGRRVKDSGNPAEWRQTVEGFPTRGGKYASLNSVCRSDLDSRCREVA